MRKLDIAEKIWGMMGTYEKLCSGCGGRLIWASEQIPPVLYSKKVPGHSGYCVRCKGCSIAPIPVNELMPK